MAMARFRCLRQPLCLLPRSSTPAARPFSLHVLARSATVAAAAGGHPQEPAILGIESSCDDTAAAVVTASGRILGEAVIGQAEIHREWGGVVPSLAAEAHAAAIDQAVANALAAADIAPADLQVCRWPVS